MVFKVIIVDYNKRYGMNYGINNFDFYYQDVQQCIKDQQFFNWDLFCKGEEKIDVIIVVDMFFIGFDVKFFNMFYVDKNFKYYGLIQVFFCINCVFNVIKFYGYIFDFCDQQDNVDVVIVMFFGVQFDWVWEIWLVDKVFVVIDNFKQVVVKFDEFMKVYGFEVKFDQVNNLKGDDVWVQFINWFKEVQWLQIQLDQYIDFIDEQCGQIEQVFFKDDFCVFWGVYFEIVQCLKEQQGKFGGEGELINFEVDQFDFEFVFFVFVVIDYDYIMQLIVKYLGQDLKKVKISCDQFIGLIQLDVKFFDEWEEIIEYVCLLIEGEGFDEVVICVGYEQFKVVKQVKEIEVFVQVYGLVFVFFVVFVDIIFQCMIFDGE